MRYLLILFACAALYGQRGTYTAEYKATLSSTTSVVVIQFPTAATATSAQMLEVAVYSSVELEVTTERGGTMTEGTEIAAVGTQAGFPAASGKVYRSATITGTSVMSRAVIPAGQTVKFPMSDVSMLRASPPQSVIIRTASGSGTVITCAKWREY